MDILLTFSLCIWPFTPSYLLANFWFVMPGYCPTPQSWWPWFATGMKCWLGYSAICATCCCVKYFNVFKISFISPKKVKASLCCSLLKLTLSLLKIGLFKLEFWFLEFGWTYLQDLPYLHLPVRMEWKQILFCCSWWSTSLWSGLPFWLCFVLPPLFFGTFCEFLSLGLLE